MCILLYFLAYNILLACDKCACLWLPDYRLLKLGYVIYLHFFPLVEMISLMSNYNHMGFG
jgi:hypothetical protein